MENDKGVRGDSTACWYSCSREENVIKQGLPALTTEGLPPVARTRPGHT